MSIPYHTEIFNNGDISINANFSGIKGDVADENLKLTFCAFDKFGNPKFTEILEIEDVRKLYRHLDLISIIKDGSKKSSKFIETTEEINLIFEKLIDSDLETILTLLQKFQSNEKITVLLNSLQDLEIENLYGAYHHKVMCKEIANLQKLIKIETTPKSEITKEIDKHTELLKYSAKQPEKIFQNWIESNLWVFGIEYIKKHDFRKIAMFSEGDLLMETVDGYLDLIELKRPSHELLKYDKSHDCHYPHQDLSIVLGQSMFYLQKLSEFKLTLQNEYKVKVLMPRIKIIVGRNDSHNEAQNDCIRILNANLNSIQVITYDDLVSFGHLLLKANEKNLPVASLVNNEPDCDEPKVPALSM